MYFEKHVCNSRTTEPERSLWRPATSKSPQRCKVASPPPPAHCPRSTSRVVRIVRLQRHCYEVAIFARVPPPFKMYPARSGRRWSTATVDVHAAEAARTRRRSVQEGLSKRGGHSGVARSSVGGNGESTCAMCDAARWPVGRRRPLQNQLNWTRPSAPRVDAHERHNENPRGARVDARLALVRQGCDELARHKAIDMCVTCKISVFLP